jgi:hypothetical protein
MLTLSSPVALQHHAYCAPFDSTSPFPSCSRSRRHWCGRAWTIATAPSFGFWQFCCVDATRTEQCCTPDFQSTSIRTHQRRTDLLACTDSMSPSAYVLRWRSGHTAHFVDRRRPFSPTSFRCRLFWDCESSFSVDAPSPSSSNENVHTIANRAMQTYRHSRRQNSTNSTDMQARLHSRST